MDPYTDTQEACSNYIYTAYFVYVDKGEGAVRDLAKNQWDRSAIGRNLQVYKVIAAVRDGLLAI